MITLKQILKDKNSILIKEEYDSKLLPDLDITLKYIKETIDKNETIGILGDFDTDGITATSSFVLGLRDLFPGINVKYKVPERSDGHGIKKENIDLMFKNGVKLLFSCDNGSNDIDMIHYAQSLGIKVVITDHHQITIPKEDIDYPLMNCEREDSLYPEKHLCGCGIVYKLLQAIENSGINKGKLKEETLITIRQLTCIATVVDMVQLKNENLFFVSEFRKLFENSNNSKFIKLLIKLTGYTKDNGSWFGWNVGPVFNGAGRLERANGLIKLITESDSIENSEEILEYYVQLNNYRKEITVEWNSFMKERIIKTKHINLIVHKDIPAGLRRLVSNNYLENKVAFCGGVDDKGIVNCSVSNEYGINLLDFLREKEYTTNVGGHYGAFGYSYKENSQELFLKDLNKYIESLNLDFSKKDFDYELKGKDITLSFVKEISSFVWGVGLELPKFKINTTVKKGFILAKKHMKLTLQLDNGQIVDAIKWGETNIEEYDGKTLDFYVSLSINEYKGKQSIQFFF